MPTSPSMKNGDEVAHYVSARKQRGRGKVRLQPPLTPMIDVTFQLLIFFMLTMTFRQAEGVLPGNLPAGDIGDGRIIDPDIAVRIVIMPHGEKNELARYELSDSNFRMDTGEQLFQALTDRKASMGGASASEVSLVLQPYMNVKWNWVTEAYNQAVRAEFKKISFATN